MKDHSEMSKRVRETCEEFRGESVARLAAELAKVVDRDYAVAEAERAAAHWTDTFSDQETPADAKNDSLDSCRFRHSVWAKVVEYKTPKTF